MRSSSAASTRSSKRAEDGRLSFSAAWGARAVRQGARRAHAGGRHDRARPRPASTLPDRKSTRLNSSHSQISYAVFCLKKKKNKIHTFISDGNFIYNIDRYIEALKPFQQAIHLYSIPLISYQNTVLAILFIYSQKKSTK